MKTTILAASLWLVAAPTDDGRTIDPGAPIQTDSRLWFTGAFGLQDFACRASDVSGQLDLRAHATRRPVLSGENASRGPSLRVPVARLDCGSPAMNRQLRAALRSADYPTIDFRLDAYDVDFAAAPTVRLTGRLTIAGAERPVALTAAVRADTSGALHVRGVYVVRMTDFGVRPPRRFAGLLRVRDRVAVHFDIVPGGEDDEMHVARDNVVNENRGTPTPIVPEGPRP
jgi:hypothetical protein